MYILGDVDESTETASVSHFTAIYETLLRFIGYATLVLVFLGYFAERLLLMLRYVIAWKQDKWMNKIGRL